MYQPPPIPDQKYETTLSQLKLLRILYFVMAGFSLIGILFMLGHYAMMTHFLSLASKAPQSTNQPPFNPEDFFAIFKWFYIVVGALITTGGILNIFTAIFIGRRTNRTFCIVVAAANCLHFPFGTALGVFSLITLMKPETEAAFSRNPNA